jgi:hypothetical protein
MPVIPTLERLKQKDHKSKASLGYTSILKQRKTKQGLCDIKFKLD